MSIWEKAKAVAASMGWTGTQALQQHAAAHDAMMTATGQTAVGERITNNCDRPPAGWHCKLPRGHAGPCPTYPDGVSWRYGDGNTIHDSDTVDVQLDEHGHVHAVWFRCQQLRWTESVPHHTMARRSPEDADLPRLVAVELAD